MGARSSMDARDAKLAMKGLSETGTYRFPQLNSSSTLFSDNWKERGVKMRQLRRTQLIDSAAEQRLNTNHSHSHYHYHSITETVQNQQLTKRSRSTQLMTAETVAQNAQQERNSQS